MEDLTVEQQRVLDHIDRVFGGHEVVAWDPQRGWVETHPMYGNHRWPSLRIQRDGSTNRDEACVLAALHISELHSAGIGRITGLPLPTVLRCLADLVERGLVEHHEDMTTGRFGIIEHERRS